MRILERRLKKLEAGDLHATTRPDPSRHAADLIRERRRRRLEAGGQPFVDRPRWTDATIPGRRLSAAETLRLCRQYRVEQRIKEESEGIGPKHLQAS
jgi:hypothetical protein